MCDNPAPDGGTTVRAAMLTCVFLCLPSLAFGAEPALPYTVGVAKVDITPDHPIRLNGFGGRRAESEGVYQKLHARALAIEDGS